VLLLLLLRCHIATAFLVHVLPIVVCAYQLYMANLLCGIDALWLIVITPAQAVRSDEHA